MYIYIMYSIDHLSIESYGDLGIPKLEKRAAHVRLERHPAKIQKVKSQKVHFLTFRLFFFPLTFSTFRLFFFPLDSQRFKFCTFSWACSAGKASGKNSNSQKVKSQKVYFSTFRLFEIHKDTFSLFDFLLLDFSTFRNSKQNLSTFRFFVFRLFEIEHTFRLEPCSTSFPRTPISRNHLLPPAISLKKIGEKRLGTHGDPSLR